MLYPPVPMVNVTPGQAGFPRTHSEAALGFF